MLQRIAYVRGIPAAAAECDSLESTSVLLPVLRDLCMDDDPEVRHAAAAVVGPLGEHAHHASARRHAAGVCWALPRALGAYTRPCVPQLRRYAPGIRRRATSLEMRSN